MPNHWEADDYSHAEVDYSGGPRVDSPSSRRPIKRKAATQAAKMRRYRARHRTKCREYNAKWMADYRAKKAAGAAESDA